MTDPRDLERLRLYLSQRGGELKIKSFLGEGTDGAVWSTEDDAAVKVLKTERGYFNERDSYARLAQFGVIDQLEGFWLPQMRGFNDELLIIEMDLMQRPPYIIDFAKVRIDRPPEFSDEVLRDLEVSGLEMFGRNWDRVKMLMAALESFQIYYLDPKPHNIVFGAEAQ